ncbi:MAG: hypothetical protein CVV22_09835 [Ignavibacteriae bacterium HGW-Ignavibacteriae-1]|jgi:5-hydroxyisourate hydrolase-like protein (transthyretin family)|nr:MAG: hypothetical protein CVV22_09835 [Ignavibacteriae bacterium HGW-Ignavibacteriae-1]
MSHFKYLISALALVAILFVSCNDNSSSPALTEDFTGFVKNGEDQAIENANIEIFGLEDKLIASDITDIEGKFTLTSIPINKEGLTYRVTHAEYATISGDFETFFDAHKSEAGKTPVVFKLLQEDSCCGDLTVQVLDYETGEPLDSVEVKVARGEDWSEKKYTDSEGIQSFGALCAGKYWLRFALDGYKVVEEDFTIVSCDTLNLTIKMKVKEEEECCNNTLNFVVTDEDGNAISNARVNLYRDGKLVEDNKTNEEGKLTYKELCKGKYSYAILKDSYKGLEGYHIFDCEENITVNKTLVKEDNSECCNNTLNFLVKDENGNPINEAKVILYRNGKAVHDGRTNDQGKITYNELCKGKYSYAILKETYKGLEGYHIFECEENISVEKTLIKKEEECCNNSLNFVVRDEDGNAISNARVNLYRDGKLVEDNYTNEEGKLTYNELCKGKYSYAILKDTYKGQEGYQIFDCGENITVEKTLVKENSEDCCGSLKIIVRDKTTNNPIPDAEVKITRLDNKFQDIKKTGDNGGVEFTKLCVSKYWIRVAHENYKVTEDYVYIEDCEQGVEKTIQLTAKEDECCDNNINFIVKDGEGNPLNGVKIKLMQGGTVKKTLETQNGTASTGKILCNGSYKVVMMKEGYQAIEFETSVECHDDITIDKKLEAVCCDGQIKIAVQDAETEEALNGAKVRLWKDGKVQREGIVENGYVLIKELCEGKYGIDIMYEGYNGIEFQYEISCKNDNYLVKKLSKK